MPGCGPRSPLLLNGAHCPFGKGSPVKTPMGTVESSLSLCDTDQCNMARSPIKARPDDSRFPEVARWAVQGARSQLAPLDDRTG